MSNLNSSVTTKTSSPQIRSSKIRSFKTNSPQTSAHSISNSLPEMVADIESDADLGNHPVIPWVFNLEGTFLGLLGEPPEKVTAIVLSVDQEEMAIALPKHLANAVKHAVRRHTLRLGDRVRCIGRSRLNFTESVIQLQAYCLFIDTLLTDAPLADSPSANPKTPLTKAPLASNEQRGKIIVCYKSGCKKRGGRQLLIALENTLREQRLNGQIEIQYTGCQKQCSKAPSLTIMPGRHRYDGLNPQDIPMLLEKHFPQTLSAECV